MYLFMLSQKTKPLLFLTSVVQSSTIDRDVCISAYFVGLLCKE